MILIWCQIYLAKSLELRPWGMVEHHFLDERCMLTNSFNNLTILLVGVSFSICADFILISTTEIMILKKMMFEFLIEWLKFFLKGNSFWPLRKLLKLDWQQFMKETLMFETYGYAAWPSNHIMQDTNKKIRVFNYDSIQHIFKLQVKAFCNYVVRYSYQQLIQEFRLD